jgi:hypothetical protein
VVAQRGLPRACRRRLTRGAPQGLAAWAQRAALARLRSRARDLVQRRARAAAAADALEAWRVALAEAAVARREQAWEFSVAPPRTPPLRGAGCVLRRAAGQEGARGVSGALELSTLGEGVPGVEIQADQHVLGFRV